jgi:hypothetical protein
MSAIVWEYKYRNVFSQCQREDSIIKITKRKKTVDKPQITRMGILKRTIQRNWQHWLHKQNKKHSTL